MGSSVLAVIGTLYLIIGFIVAYLMHRSADMDSSPIVIFGWPIILLMLFLFDSNKLLEFVFEKLDSLFDRWNTKE